MFLSRWKGHLKLLQPVTLFCDALAIVALGGIAFVLTPISFIASWVLNLFNIEGPNTLKWAIIGFCAISLGLKHIMFNSKGIKESQWVDKKWLKEFQHFTPKQLDHYATEHLKFHRMLAFVWVGAALLNFNSTGFLILGILHVITTFYWKQHQHKTSKMLLPHGEVEHFPMEIVGAIEDPLEQMSALKENIWNKGEEQLQKIAHRLAPKSSGQRSVGHTRHPGHTLKQAVRHKVKHAAKDVEQHLKPGH